MKGSGGGDVFGRASGAAFAEAREQTVARLMTTIVPVFLAVIGIAAAGILVAGPGHRARLVPTLMGVAPLLVIWWLSRTGRALPAGNLFAALLGVCILAGMTLNGGVHAPIYAFGITLVGYVSLAVGLRAALFSWAGFVLVGGLFVWLEHGGWLRPVAPPPPTMMWVLFSGYMLVTIVFTAVPAFMLHRALAEAEARSKEAEEATRQLRDREKARRESEERFRTLVTNMPGTAYRAAFDADGTMEFVSDEVEHLTGRPSGDFIANRVRSFASIIHRDDAARVRAAVSAGVERREPFSVEYRIRHADGRERWVCEKGVPLFDEKGAFRFLDGLIFDVTDIRQAKDERERLRARLAQARKLEAIGTLAGGIAHDFNNILAIMTGYAEVALLKIPKHSSEAENLRQVLVAGERGSQLVGQILTFSRQADVSPVPCELGPIVKETVKFMGATLPANIRIRHRIDVVGAVLADPTQVHQVIMNLCTNALHAMEERGGTLEISLTEVEIARSGPLQGIAAGRYALLAVSDSGCGMATDVHDRIFDPYYTTKPAGKGTGLGLAVVHGIVAATRGEIKVSSEPGVGTTFRVYLPLSRRAAAGEMRRDRAAETCATVPTGH